MIHLLVLISLLACKGVIGFTLNAAMLSGISNQSSTITITNNDITDIDPNAFKGYSKVTSLFMYYTALVKVDLSLITT